MDETRIDLKVTFSQLKTLITLVEESAMMEGSYGVVGLRRELKDYLHIRIENSKGERRYLCYDCIVKGLDKVLGKPKIKNRE